MHLLFSFSGLPHSKLPRREDTLKHRDEVGKLPRNDLKIQRESSHQCSRSSSNRWFSLGQNSSQEGSTAGSSCNYKPVAYPQWLARTSREQHVPQFTSPDKSDPTQPGESCSSFSSTIYQNGCLC